MDDQTRIGVGRIEIDGVAYKFEITAEAEVVPGPALAAIMAGLQEPSEPIDGEAELHWRARSVLEALWRAGLDIYPVHQDLDV